MRSDLSFGFNSISTDYNCFWQEHFGKYYLTTSKDLDYAREQFTFDVNALSSYVLGRAQHGSISLPAAGEEATETINTAQAASVVSNSTLEIDVLQVQEAVVGLLERMGRLEQLVSEHVLDRRSSRKRKLDS